MGDGNKQTLSYSDDPSTKHTKCLPSCQFQMNDFSLSSTSFPSEAAFPYMNQSCVVFQKIVRICAGGDGHRRKLFEAKYPNLDCSTVLALNKTGQLCDADLKPKLASIKNNNPIRKHLFEYTKANVAQLKVFFRDPIYTKLIRDVEMTVVSFIGSAGGLLGLFLGLSMISIFEVLYHLGTFIHAYFVKKLVPSNKVFKVMK